MDRDILAWLKVASAVAATIWRETPVLVQILCVVMLADIVTGMVAAGIERRLSSTVSLRGIARKSVVLILVGVAYLIGGHTGLPIAEPVVGFYIMHEGLSVLENAARIGVPVPEALRQAFDRFGGKRDDQHA